MSNTRDRSDDRPVRGRGWKFMAGLITAGLGAGMAGVGLNAGATRLGDVFSDANAGIVTGIGFGVFLVGLMIAWKLRPGGPASRGEDEPGKRERMQAQRVRQLWIFPIVTLAFLVQSTRSVQDILEGERSFGYFLGASLPVVYAWVVASITMGWDHQSRKNRRFLDDELTTVLRARAIGAAFVVLMLGATVAFGLGLWRIELGVMALPFALSAAGATAGIRFASLDREFGKDG